MRALFAILAVGLTATAAIAEPASSPKAPAKTGAMKVNPNDPNIANRKLMAMKEDDRRAMFLLVLATNGQNCSEVTRTFYQGSAKPSWNAIWNATCRDGVSYVINIMSDEVGTATTLTCGQLRARGGGECFTRPPQ